MENEVYEKDYGEEFRERSDKSEGKDFLSLWYLTPMWGNLGL